MLDQIFPFAEDPKSSGRTLKDCRVLNIGAQCCWCVYNDIRIGCEKHNSLREPCRCKNYCFPREDVSISTKFIDLMNYFGNIGGFDLILNALSTRDAKLLSKGEKVAEENQSMQTPSLTSICMLTKMVSMPFQLFHHNFVLGVVGEEEDEIGEEEEEKDAWMFFSPSSYPSKKTEAHARSYWKIDGDYIHEASKPK